MILRILRFWEYIKDNPVDPEYARNFSGPIHFPAQDHKDPDSPVGDIKDCPEDPEQNNMSTDMGLDLVSS